MRPLMIMAILLLPASAGAAAMNPNFDYTSLEAGYRVADFDEEDGDGYQLAGSFGFGNNGFIVAGARRMEGDVNIISTPASGDNGLFGTDVEYDFDYEVRREDVALGIGAAWPLGSRLDLVAQVAYVESELSESLVGGRVTTDFLWTDDPTLVESPCVLGLCETVSVDDQGFASSIGLRGKASERIEVYGNVTHYDIDLAAFLESHYGNTTLDMDGGDMTFEVGTRVNATENLLFSLAYAKQADIESLQVGVRMAL